MKGEEKKGVSLVDQSKHNMPIHQATDDMLELLENNIRKIGLNPEEKDTLRDGLKSGSFSVRAKEVADQLRRRGKYDTATMVQEMGPLYDPHDFWDK